MKKNADQLKLKLSRIPYHLEYAEIAAVIRPDEDSDFLGGDAVEIIILIDRAHGGHNRLGLPDGNSSDTRRGPPF
ncbi:MAG: hypothetical protein V8Q30_08850 [Acutalibacteraceae bacterium]